MVGGDLTHTKGDTGPREEPAKWLIRDDPSIAISRIRGLHTVEETREWIDFEVRHRSRQDIIGLLNQRQAELQEMGYYDRTDLPWTEEGKVKAGFGLLFDG